MTLVLTLADATTDTALSKLERDLAIYDGATEFLYDLGKVFSWPSAAAPSNGAAVKDLTARVADGTVVTSSTGPTFAGAGFDFAGVTASASHMVKTPTTVMTAIQAATNQYWAAVHYYKLPVSGDWPAGQANIAAFSSNSAIPSPGLFMLTMHVNGANKILVAYFGRSGGSFTGLETAIGAITPFLGTVTQVMVWRDATGIHMRLKNATNEYTITAAVGSKNTDAFGAKYASFGVVDTLRPTGNARNFRFYRAFLENLDVSGRAATTVADADWTRNGARFS